MTLAVFVDFASAAARLAIGPTRALAGRLGIVLDWQPLAIARRDNPSAADQTSSRRGAVHARVRTQYRAREQAWYARVQGIDLVTPPGPAHAANAALLWANRHEAGDAWVRDAFAAVWSGRLDPDDSETVARSLASVCPTDGFADWLAGAAPAELEATRERAFERGVPDVPAYLVGDELFVGREHLPMIAWLLEGRSGPAPG